ncbi:MAG: deaminase [Trueperaceae bacterium]|nr:deaminase [Trueperaceae bacterium]
MSCEAAGAGRHEQHLRKAVALAHENVLQSDGRPFGAVLTRDGEEVATGVNTMLATGDPTAHAELEALRAAAGRGALGGQGEYVMYASGHPCPMCLGAMLMLGVGAVYYAYSNEEGRPFGLSTEHVYAELAKPATERAMRFTHLPVRLEGVDPYAAWVAARRAG